MPVERFIWTLHALERLSQRGIRRDAAERLVRESHPGRHGNDGEADWRIEGGGLVILYDHPYAGNRNAVRIVTAWRKRHKRPRHLKSLGDSPRGLS